MTGPKFDPEPKEAYESSAKPPIHPSFLYAKEHLKTPANKNTIAKIVEKREKSYGIKKQQQLQNLNKKPHQQFQRPTLTQTLRESAPTSVSQIQQLAPTEAPSNTQAVTAAFAAGQLQSAQGPTSNEPEEVKKDVEMLQDNMEPPVMNKTSSVQASMIQDHAERLVTRENGKDGPSV